MHARWILGLAVATASVLTLAATSLAGGTGASAGAALLPDLDPVAPASIKAVVAGDDSGRTFLTFSFGYDNTGKGPLIVRGHRTGIGQTAMTADQLVKRDGGTTVTYPRIGKIGWLPDRGFKRWGFKLHSYRLTPVKGGRTRVAETLPLCVEDNRHTPHSKLPGEPNERVFHGRCGRGNDGLLSITLGLSVGWRNLHLAEREGQLIDITKLPSGEYILSTRVNAAGAIHESSTANNTSSARVSITWSAGKRLPAIKVIADCDDSATCG